MALWRYSNLSPLGPGAIPLLVVFLRVLYTVSASIDVDDKLAGSAYMSA